MNKIIKYKLKEMITDFLCGFGAFMTVFGIPFPLCVFISYLIHGWQEGRSIGYGFIYWILFITVIGIIITIICAIKNKWDSIKVPITITDEKAQDESGALSISENNKAGGLSVS